MGYSIHAIDHKIKWSVVRSPEGAALYQPKLERRKQCEHRATLGTWTDENMNPNGVALNGDILTERRGRLLTQSSSR